ncbi:MAG: hypothetical protein OET07_00390 [Desulfobacteraceae bacterium]|nr:hypothetical protein [Desulfobacteraceae bacterium]MDH3721660.1 hypothetical protein [Desulfobacteraceae bacterium]MDH3837691.1 hypothetical protein [Desulfobacteraceae bacterium]MDH3872588.1 hypothetical protein [Desulfobacteraceae bacterium]
MSKSFFDDLGIPKPDINLGISSDGKCSQQELAQRSGSTLSYLDV